MRASRSFPLAASLLLCVGQVGCISTPLVERDWLTLETPHFEVVATYPPEEAVELGVHLEQFRDAVEHIWGQRLPVPARRIRVIAYDGAGSERPFRLPQREGSYLVARPGGETLVFRSPYGWGEASTTGLRLELARRLFRNAGAVEEPPWLVEGLAQVASTSDVRGGRRLRLADVIVLPVLPIALIEIAADTPDRVNIGQPQKDHVEQLRTEHWISLERLAAAGHLAGWSERDRRIFEAESWLLAHWMLFGPRDSEAAADPLDATRRGLRRGVPGPAAVEAALGDGLGNRLARYARSEVFDGVVLSVAPPAGLADPRPLEGDEIGERLGETALQLELFELAERYYRDALEHRPEQPALLAGLCVARVRQDLAPEGACERARAGAADDPVVLGRLADAERSRIAAAATADERRRRARRAADLYARALATREGDPALHYGLAAARLEAGDAAGALESLARVRSWLPGDPEVQRLTARAELAGGDPEAARDWARRAATNARSRDEIEAALAQLHEIEQHARN